MAIEIKAPSFPESVADGTVATWHKKPGEAVKRDDLIVDIETDKVVLEVLAEADGVLGAIIAEEGATVLSNQVLGSIEEGSAAAPAPAAAAAAPAAASAPAAAPAAGAEDPIAAPAARQLAEENGMYQPLGNRQRWLSLRHDRTAAGLGPCWRCHKNPPTGPRSVGVDGRHHSL